MNHLLGLPIGLSDRGGPEQSLAEVRLAYFDITQVAAGLSCRNALFLKNAAPECGGSAEWATAVLNRITESLDDSGEEVTQAKRFSGTEVSGQTAR